MKPVESLALAEAPAAPAWPDLLRTHNPALLCGAWLDHLDQGQVNASRSMVLLRGEHDDLQLTALRPPGAAVDDLSPLLARASTTLEPACMPLKAGLLLTVPLLWAGQLRGLVALQFATREQAEAAQALVRWGSGWLLALLVRLAADKDQAALAEARRLLELMAGVFAEADFAGASLAAANRLALLWGASSVAMGWVQTERTVVIARTNAAENDPRANLIGQLAAAMDEALDLRQTVQCMAGKLPEPHQPKLPQHRALARETQAEATVSALLFDEGVAVGVVLIERDLPLSAAELDRLDTQCMMLAPLLAQKRAADRSLWQHARASSQAALHRLGDGSAMGWKLAGGVAALLLLLAALVPVPLRITSPAVVEGEIQRSIAAPFQGFVSTAVARAGDVVRAGQLLATLEDKDLLLDQSRWSADLELASRKEREAMAVGNRVDLRLAAAQANQARAQLDLVQQKLSRVQIVAPFDGVVVRGDLSQSLGSPVEQGKVLFELAPLDAWRVILKVDERDVSHVRLNQTGLLMLSGLSGTQQDFSVSRITSIATAEEGRNYFRVEAGLNQHDLKLRPGMEGVAKIDAGSGSALWVWTRRLTDWLRLTLWEWSP